MNGIILQMGRYFLYFILIFGIIASSFFLIHTYTIKTKPAIPEPAVAIDASATKPFTILIVPGHDTDSSATKNNKPGPYHGFNIFIPDNQRVNAATSRIITESIYNELQKKFTPETPGNTYNSLYQDQSLIALGASNTLTKPAILIEYAYVYEKMLQTPASQKQALEQMAQQTVAGIQDYVNSKSTQNIN